MPQCPICSGRRFVTYRGRPNARCSGCGSKERARFLAIVLKRLSVPNTGKPVIHFAPEEAISEILWRRYGRSYVPADLEPEGYAWTKAPGRKIDLSNPREYLGRNSVSIVIHSHVLEHVYAPIDRILREINDAIVPGGYHIFQVPVEKGWYREDMNKDMSPDKRTEMYGQHDHVRIFGANDFNDHVLRHFQGFERIDTSSLLTERDLINACVPAHSLSRPTGHTVFAFRKQGRIKRYRGLLQSLVGTPVQTPP